MKKLIISNLFAIAMLQMSAQPVGKSDAVVLLNELAAPSTTIADAYQRAYPNGNTSPDAAQYYQSWTNKVENANRETQELLRQFYMKYPTGVRPQAQPVSRVTPQQESAMSAATSELTQKMLSDPAFAQKFMQMSEQEQHAYMAKLLADKGIKPVNGTPNTDVKPAAGTDIEWVTLCTDYSQPAIAMSRWEAQTALQQKYEGQHQQVRDWAEAEIKKLPLIEMGEYGRDRDPEKVKAIQKQALVRHRDVAEAMLKEAATVFAQSRQELSQRMTPLNDALKSVNYGAAYDFGYNYTTVLGTQATMFGEVHNIMTNEANIINECARWEYELRNFK